MQFQLLLNLDVISDLSFILLQLLLILLGRHLQTLVRRGELGRCATSIPRHPAQHSVGAVPSMLLFLVQFHLHENLDAGSDVFQNGDGVKPGKAFPLVFELVLFKHVDFLVRSDLHLQVQVNYHIMDFLILRVLHPRNFLRAG